MDPIDNLRLVVTPRLLGCGLFKVRISPRVIVFTSPQLPDAHFTLHLGERSGRFDLHKTPHDLNIPRQTIGALRHSAFAVDEAILKLIAFRAIARFLACSRPIRPGWLSHHGFLLGPSYIPFIRNLRAITDGSQKTTITGRELAEKLCVPTSIEAATVPTFGIYPLYQYSRRQLTEAGLVFRLPKRDGTWEFRLLRLSTLNMLMEETAARIKVLAVPHLVDPEEHVRLLESMLAQENTVGA